MLSPSFVDLLLLFCQLTQGLEEERSELFKKLTVKGCKCTLEEELQETKRANQIEDHDEISTQVHLMPFCAYVPTGIF